MSQTLLRRLALLAVALCAAIGGVVGFTAGTVSAHNTLVSSDPADGAELAVAPTQITWTFDKPVPLETLTVTLIDAAGARTELSGSSHGAAGDTEVVTPLPSLQPGPVSVRWRLVGPDGHPITGLVSFTITSPTTTTVGDTTVGDTTVPSSPTTAPPVTAASTTPPTTAGSSIGRGDGSYSTPTFIRWVLRYTSYLAIMAIVGILVTTAFVWSGAGGHPILRRVVSRSLSATAALGFLQLLIIASDISGKAPWSSLGSVGAATTTDAGMALAVRIAIAAALWLVVFRAAIVHPDVYWTAVSMAGLGLLATWAFAGHSRSMRWPASGVVTDIAHHAAAAAWIAGLATVGLIIIPRAAPEVLTRAVRRFSRVAATSVAVLVGTGLLQTVRLVGSPFDLLDTNHGRYLAAKILVLAVMLVIANVNRRRIDPRLHDRDSVRLRSALRQAVIAEFAIGLVIVAITAAMVVSPPSTTS